MLNHCDQALRDSLALGYRVMSAEVPPFDLAEAREALKAPTDTSDDPAVKRALFSAIAEAEIFLNRFLTITTVEITRDSWPISGEFRLYYPPFVSIEAVEYTNAAGGTSSVAAQDYVSDFSGLIGRLRSAPSVTGWPTLGTGINRVRVRYRCGYTASNLPGAVKNGVYLLAEDLYERETRNAEAARRLLSAYRVPLP